uniref:Solute carrier family 2, facilitated glucose transporter member 10 n=1 Tax=Neogobius melanostomus TaxID=47308 RepID=A0A8C6URM9_9GOBI
MDVWPGRSAHTGSTGCLMLSSFSHSIERCSTAFSARDPGADQRVHLHVPFPHKGQHENTDHDWSCSSAVSTVDRAAQCPALRLHHLLHAWVPQPHRSPGLGRVGAGQSPVHFALYGIVGPSGASTSADRGCSVMAISLMIIGLLCTHSHVDEMTCVSKDISSNANITTTYAHVTVNDNETTINGGASLETKSPFHAPAANGIVLLSLMAVVGAYSIGFGPLTWLLLSEIFPAEVRGRAFAFTNCFNWSAHLLVTSTFLNLVDAIGLPGLFVSYGAIASAAAVFFCKILPETKGKSLEDIDQELRLHRFYQKQDCCSFACKRNRPPIIRRCSVKTCLDSQCCSFEAYIKHNKALKQTCFVYL